MIVLQLRHENVSNCELSSSDLLLSIASPQSGQCRIGGRGGAGIGGHGLRQPYCLLAQSACARRSAQYRDECNHDDLCWHRMTPLFPVLGA
jgi:hypothetical protein